MLHDCGRERDRLGCMANPTDARIHDALLRASSTIWPLVHNVDLCVQVILTLLRILVSAEFVPS